MGWIVGTAGNDSLTGTAGADTLFGGLGIDTLVGGLGNDTYIVDTTTDIITESITGGTDTVLSTATSYTLPGKVENVKLQGVGDISGTGNSLSNIVTGNSGNNTIDGSTGGDTLIGGAGNDVYIVDNAGDIVTELSGEGIDTVQTFISYTLPSEVDNLKLTGIATVSGTGNSMDNTIAGNTAANTLVGGLGNDTLSGDTGTDSLDGGLGNDVLWGGLHVDTLTGGDGADSFRFVVSADSGTGVSRDIITDFTTGVDKIDLTGLALTGGVIGTAAFTTVGQVRWAFYGTGATAYAVVQITTTPATPTTASMEIKLNLVTTLVTSDFLL
jgi:Ca2+-binding RTX toxin-like protein